MSSKIQLLAKGRPLQLAPRNTAEYNRSPQISRAQCDRQPVPIESRAHAVAQSVRNAVHGHGVEKSSRLEPHRYDTQRIMSAYSTTSLTLCPMIGATTLCDFSSQ
jgi:hypothetical protein